MAATSSVASSVAGTRHACQENPQATIDIDILYSWLCINLKGFLVVKCSTDDDQQCLVLTHQKLHDHPPLGLTSRVRILVKRNEYVVHVLLREIQRGILPSYCPEKQIYQLCSRYASDLTTCKFCPGLDTEEYERMRETIRFDIASVRKTQEPFLRIDSKSCLLRFELGSNCRLERRKASTVMCPSCVRLKCDLQHQVKRTSSESPSKKIKRQASSSHARLTYMSPTSQQRRKNNQLNYRKRLIKKLSFQEAQVPLDDLQNDEVSAVMTYIENNHQDELEKLFDEGHILKEIWKDDVNVTTQNDQQAFQLDQKCNNTGKQGNRWNMVTIRLALAVYIRSSAAYEALKSFGVMQLPCRSTLQGAFLHEPGAYSSCIEEQVAQFVIHCQKRVSEGKKESKSDGVLIFDEVKVISRLMWNSRSQTLIGLSMTQAEMGTLSDIYQTVDNAKSPSQTTHILQFLWRDLTSNYDIIGPYFTSPGTADTKFTLSCVLETVKLFQLHGLATSLLVCDGASSNLALIKATHGFSGAYPIMKGEKDPYAFSPLMVNPFNPPNPIFWLICPTHQLKNMINALFSSRGGGTKSFVLDKVTFGWKAIQLMFERDCQRSSQGLTRMVPKLKESHIIRDAWTKLNVTPAKIMQQEKVLLELFMYIDNNPEEAVCNGTKATLSYLEACNNIFEEGFLSHNKITSMESEVLTSINKGYTFFTSWLNQILEDDPNFKHSSNEQKKFLAWQTFDLLRIDVNGFNLFCEYFIKKYPGYFVSPLRISGSAVETLFSQFKYSVGGKLDAANYSHSRAVCLVKQVSAPHHSGKDYRDCQLAVPDLRMTKKIYNKKTVSK